MYRAKRREWEAEYVSECTRVHYAGCPVRFHMRLGTWPTPLSAPELTEPEQMLLKVRMRWADAVVIAPGELIIVEAKLRPTEYLKGLAELEVYVHLAAHTPELTPVMPRTIIGHLFTSLEDPVVAYLARSKGLRYTCYEPTFWLEYCKILSHREKRPIRPEELELIAQEK